MKKRSTQFLYRLLQVLLVVGLVGFWFHTSEMGATVFGKYSRQYFKAAIGVSLLGGLPALASCGFSSAPNTSPCVRDGWKSR